MEIPEFQTPLIGSSNKETYDELTYQPINFSNLIDIDWNPAKEPGVPELRAQFVLNISNTNSQNTFKSLYATDSTTNVEQDGNSLILPLENSNWISSYSENIWWYNILYQNIRFRRYTIRFSSYLYKKDI